MKLNLLPTHVSKEGQSKIAWVAAGVMMLAGVAGAVFGTIFSSGKVAEAKARVAQMQPLYDQCKATADKADAIMESSVVINRNLTLAREMDKHNTVYPDLYADVLAHIPSFLRVTSLNAVPADATNCTVTINGVLQTADNYTDAMLALLRIPGATNVTRSGFVDYHKVVPSLNENDQLGLPVKPGETNLPSDRMKRLDEMINRANAAPKGYLNINGFGSSAPQKGAMPDWSPVTFTVTLTRNIMTPIPMATLKAQGEAGAAAPAANTGGFAAPGGANPGANPGGASNPSGGATPGGASPGANPSSGAPAGPPKRKVGADEDNAD